VEAHEILHLYFFVDWKVYITFADTESTSMIIVMKKCVLVFLFGWMAAMAVAQVPQFSSRNFEGWIYNNPFYLLNQGNILGNKIVLYKTSTGQDFLLTSPQFDCKKGQTLEMDVTWILDQWKSEQFVASKVALTAALLDEAGTAVDSVTFTPTSVTKSINHVLLSIRVPRVINGARLRFASWRADVNSCGAVRQIDMVSSMYGDVNRDNEVSVADVNAIIDIILAAGTSDDAIMQRADVNRDGEVSLADINEVIDVIVG